MKPPVNAITLAPGSKIWIYIKDKLMIRSSALDLYIRVDKQRTE